MRIILASASPRRRILLRQIGLTFEVVPAAVPEDVENGADPVMTVERLALSKAEAVVDRHQSAGEYRKPAAGMSTTTGSKSAGNNGALFIGSDTVVVLDGNILGKPESADRAAEMLRSLSGCTHQVYTGVGLIHTANSGVILVRHRFHERTDVTFGDLTDDEIAAYVAGGSPMDKAGAYGIQDDLGALFVRKIDGDYYNVVGFPLYRFYREVNKLVPGLVTPFEKAVADRTNVTTGI